MGCLAQDTLRKEKINEQRNENGDSKSTTTATEGMLVDFNYNRDGEIPFFIPTQPIPDIPNWREWCLKLQECGVKFEFDGGFIERDWNVLECGFTFFGRHRYRIPEQPVPATIANYLNKEKTMNDKLKQVLLRLKKDGLKFSHLTYTGKLDFTAGLAWYAIEAQELPNVPNWREWCGKLQACGVMFEFNWGDDEETDWRVTECLFGMDEINDYRIPKQPVPEKIANYLNEEKTMSKFVKIQLPEIEVSEDVVDVKVCFYDGDRLLHNTAGVAIMDFEVGNGSLLGVGRRNSHYIHGTYYTEEDFKLATQPPKEMTVEEVEKILGHRVKIVGGLQNNRNSGEMR